jgi:hypothetical protein
VATRRQSDSEEPQRRGKPATTPEARENQLIAKAVDLVEKQLEEGTASAQVITHYLKLGSSREKLEQAKIALENEFLEVKREHLASAQRVEELYSEALNAMRAYAGHAPVEEDDEYED